MSDANSKPAWVSQLPLDLIQRLGQRFGVDPFLIAAIIQQESGGRMYAQRFEPNYRWFMDLEKNASRLGCSLATERAGQGTSYGLMQVMGAVMREHGFTGWFGQAFDPMVNVEFGTRHLAKFLKKYKTAPEAIASYNAGSPRLKAGTDKFVNQEYVDQVLHYWSEAAGGKRG